MDGMEIGVRLAIGIGVIGVMNAADDVDDEDQDAGGVDRDTDEYKGGDRAGKEDGEDDVREDEPRDGSTDDCKQAGEEDEADEEGGGGVGPARCASDDK
eukprot:2585904-Pyramimonas_sp.AAC.1